MGVSVVPTTRVAVPRDREHDAAVGRVRHHDRVAARQKRSVEHEMDALARRDERRRVRVHEAAHDDRSAARWR